MKIEYAGSVRVAAGWRSVTFRAEARKISPKMAEVLEITSIDGEEPDYGMSRTGARRQEYNGRFWAAAEIGKKKRIGAVRIIED